MKRKKLLKTLADLLDGKRQKQRKHQSELEALLEQLATKEAALEEQLRAGKNGRERRQIGAELEIIKAQRAKGARVLTELSRDN